MTVVWMLTASGYSDGQGFRESWAQVAAYPGEVPPRTAWVLAARRDPSVLYRRCRVEHIKDSGPPARTRQAPPLGFPGGIVAELPWETTTLPEPAKG